MDCWGQNFNRDINYSIALVQTRDDSDVNQLDDDRVFMNETEPTCISEIKPTGCVTGLDDDINVSNTKKKKKVKSR